MTERDADRAPGPGEYGARNINYEESIAENGHVIESGGFVGELRTPYSIPPLPPADAKGNRPALEYIQASIARDIIKERRALGLSQVQLAELAGLRQATLSRLESGKHSPTMRTVEKIDRALKRCAKSKSKRRGTG